MSSLLGGNSKNKQSSSTSNLAYPQVADNLQGTAGSTGDASNLMAQLLGAAPSTGAGQAGLSNFQNSSGFQNQLQQGSQAITDNAASRGLLQSGATAKALTTFGQGLASQNFNSYLQNLLGLGNQGIAANNSITAAGQVSNSSGKSSSKEGLGL